MRGITIPQEILDLRKWVPAASQKCNWVHDMGRFSHMIKLYNDDDATELMDLLLDESPPTSFIAAINYHSNGGQPPLAIDVSALPQQSTTAINPVTAGVSNLE